MRKVKLFLAASDGGHLTEGLALFKDFPEIDLCLFRIWAAIVCPFLQTLRVSSYQSFFFDPDCRIFQGLLADSVDSSGLGCYDRCRMRYCSSNRCKTAVS